VSLVPLDCADDRRRFGGKAAQLASALRAGLPVPTGYALGTSDVVDALKDSTCLAALGPGRWAVRSSAVDEDGEAASFAGQHVTRLNVPTHAVAEALKEVWASSQTPSALAYRRRLGLSGTPEMAVVIQEMVRARVAGVLFTRNPLSQAIERVIEASWGLGEAVVAGLVTPDRFRIRQDGAILERSAGEKEMEVANGEDGGTIECPVEADRAVRLCLDDGELAQLHELACEVERSFEGAQDLEWAFDEERLFLLQRRAVTR
jgi:pyruvate,water dikinase